MRFGFLNTLEDPQAARVTTRASPCLRSAVQKTINR